MCVNTSKAKTHKSASQRLLGDRRRNADFGSVSFPNPSCVNAYGRHKRKIDLLDFGLIFSKATYWIDLLDYYAKKYDLLDSKRVSHGYKRKEAQNERL